MKQLIKLAAAAAAGAAAAGSIAYAQMPAQPARSVVTIYRAAPGQQEAPLHWLAAQDRASQAAGLPAGQLYIHTDGDSWDYLGINPMANFGAGRRDRGSRKEDGNGDRRAAGARIPQAHREPYRHLHLRPDDGGPGSGDDRKLTAGRRGRPTDTRSWRGRSAAPTGLRVQQAVGRPGIEARVCRGAGFQDQRTLLDREGSAGARAAQALQPAGEGESVGLAVLIGRELREEPALREPFAGVRPPLAFRNRPIDLLVTSVQRTRKST